MEVTAAVLKVTHNSVVTEHAFMMQRGVGNSMKQPMAVAVLRTVTLAFDSKNKTQHSFRKRDFDWLSGNANASIYADEDLRDLFMGDASAPPAPGTLPPYKFVTRPSDLNMIGQVPHYQTLSFFHDARALRRCPEHSVWVGDIKDLQMEFSGYLVAGECYDIQLWEHPRKQAILGRLTKGMNGEVVGRAVLGFDGGTNNYKV